MCYLGQVTRPLQVSIGWLWALNKITHVKCCVLCKCSMEGSHYFYCYCYCCCCCCCYLPGSDIKAERKWLAQRHRESLADQTDAHTRGSCVLGFLAWPLDDHSAFPDVARDSELLTKVGRLFSLKHNAYFLSKNLYSAYSTFISHSLTGVHREQSPDADPLRESITQQAGTLHTHLGCHRGNR